MNIKEVCKRYNISADTLRYYEKVGAIPPVHRTEGGIRNYTEEDINWVNYAICLRNAGLSIGTLVEYVQLSQEGDVSIPARFQLLSQSKQNLMAQRKQLDEALDRLDYKLERYRIALETGKLEWI